MKNYELVLQQVEADLAAGRLRLGGRLPGERALAEQLGISRPSVREAVRVLEALGVVRTATGSGPEAGAVIVAEPSAPLTALLRLHLATSHLPMHDIVQTRVLLESWSAREAAALFAGSSSSAGRGDRSLGAGAGQDAVPGAGEELAAKLGEAEQLLERMDGEGLSPEEFHLLDAEFHVALAGLAGNVLIAAVMGSLRSAIHGYVLAAVPNLPDWDATAIGLRTEHHAIVAAIRDGRGDDAARLVTEHIEGFYRAARLSSPTW
ncbi:FadR/GntR family transcriptional regulator [Kribbella sp. CA-253562]|uniref:FadR/GntR family transcriptional regulator n=1 Tax=Kribbella sp. CA-253562 TaxID=3239942 RepID=UPI003D93B2A1